MKSRPFTLFVGAVLGAIITIAVLITVKACESRRLSPEQVRKVSQPAPSADVQEAKK